MKKQLLCVSLFLVLGFGRLTADDKPVAIPELHLKDGRVLHAVQLVSYGRNTIMARWEGGRGTLAYDMFPDDLKESVEQHRPPPQSEESIQKGEAAAKEYADKQRAAEIKRRAAASITTGKDNSPNTGAKLNTLTADEAKKAVDAHNVIPGLTHEQVALAWGQPSARIPSRNHGIEKWNYADRSLAVLFDKDGLVASTGPIEAPSTN